MTFLPRREHVARGDAPARGFPALLRTVLASAFAGLAFASAALAQPMASHQLDLKSGKDVFTRGCITCHGPEGKGMPGPTIGFEPPPTFPDFTDCVATAREANRFWQAIVTNGGPARGFSEIMPSFRELLTPEQIEMALDYLRTFCREPAWPRGELNPPRALGTEKAFPEDEVLVTTAINTKGTSGTDHKITYEKRFGARSQMEVTFPFSFQPQQEGGDWSGGVGDLVLGYKRVVVSNLKTGSILAVQGEAILPTGNDIRGFGKGVTVFETFAAYGQRLGDRNFLQFQSGIEMPVDTAKADRAAYWRAVFGRSMNQDEGLGRMWSPMVELLADRGLVEGATIDWDVLPQFQVTLSARQHIRANIGVKVPLNDFRSRPVQLMFYLMWDTFDGGLRDGW
jgi:mono/diheme cytochrome c family protein